jgi:hypothetical protein
MKGKMMQRSKCTAALCLLYAVNAQAQHHRYEAAVPPVSAGAYYKLPVTPEIGAYSASDLHDLRIRDAKGPEVPYLRSTELPQRWAGFVPFEIISQRKGVDGNTHLVLRNDSGQPIEALQLHLRNTAARRMASISGSSDGKTWYSLRDSFMLTPTTIRGDKAGCTLPLPLTSYPLLQLSIFDKGKLPIEVLDAGIAGSSTLRAHYTALPAPAWTQKDSGHQSYIRLRFQHPYVVQKLSFEFDAPAFYRREAALYVSDEEREHFTISSGKPAIVWTNLHDSDVLVVVYNEDNPPLHLKAVNTWQQQQYLLAFLEPSRHYIMTFGDSSLSSPLYDLRYFKDSMAVDAMQELVPDAPKAVSHAHEMVRKPLLGKGTMWVIILSVLAALIMGTIVLMKQIKSEEH